MLYRKYRPKTFREIIGQEHVVKTLQGALMRNQVGHAYLFAGPRGTGKTTIARLLAKAANCLQLTAYSQQRQSPSEKQSAASSQQSTLLVEPCNNCNSCADFLQNKAIDLIEIDAASNRGIDEIRNLRESVRFAPNKSKYKVYVIDEVHQLTKEAFNALLKTLEEPPGHVIFVLCTTEPEKVPETIRSRTQFFNFNRLPVSVIAKRLDIIANMENLKIVPEALYLIAQSGNGSVRDAESNLTKLIGFGGEKITAETVQEILGLIPFSIVAQFAAHLADRNKERVLSHVHALYEQGSDMESLYHAVMKHLRILLVIKTDPGIFASFQNDFPKEQQDFLFKQANQFESARLLRALKTFANHAHYFSITPIPQLPFEIAVSEYLET